MTIASDMIWVEKYRPQTLDDIRGNDEIINSLKDYVNDDSMPNILLAGQQGIGKTAAAVAFAKTSMVMTGRITSWI